MQRRNIMYISVVLIIAILAGYVYVYQMEPFSDQLNTLLIGLADPFVALLAALAATAVLLQYQKEDKPYLVWLCLTIAMWSWVLAESTWSFINLTTGEVPGIGLPDVFWLVGYLLFSVALRSQYQLVYQTRIAWWKVLAIWAGIFVLTYLVLFMINSEFSLGDYVEFLYAVVDFALCVASVRLFMTFGAGRLSRPWLGLFVMGISDAFFAGLTTAGLYQASSEAAALLSVFTDSTYVAAYLFIAFGFLAQYLLQRYGPEELIQSA